MEHEKDLKSHLKAALEGGQAFDKFEDVAKEFAHDERGRIPKGAEHSAWQILEHMRLALEDIYDFSKNEDNSYAEKEWPAGYWPKETLGDWDGTIKAYLELRKKMEALTAKGDPYRKFPWGDGQTLLREMILAACHEAYHVGELVELKRWLNA